MKSHRSSLTVLAALAMAMLATSAFASKYSDTIAAYGTQVKAYWQFNEAAGTSYALSTTPTSYGTPNNPQTSPTRDNVFEYLNTSGASQVSKIAVPGIDGAGVDLKDGQAPWLLSVYTASGSPVSPAFQSYTPGTFTIEWWVKPIGTANTYWNLSPYGGSGFGFYSEGTDYKHAIVGLGGDTFSNTQNIQPADFKAADSFVADQWNFVVFTFKNTGSGTGQAALYVNGVNQLASPLGYKLFTGVTEGPWNALSMRILTSPSVPSGQEAYFDELAVFDGVALSQQQILDQFYAVPEPGMLSLLALGGAFLVWRRNVAAKR